MSASRVVQVAIEPLRIALRAPFGIATGAQEVADNLLVTVMLEGGAEGLGEAAPFPAVTGETAASSAAALQRMREVVLGEDAARWEELGAELARAFPRERAARCALETALADAWSRGAGRSLLDVFGGAEEELITDLTIVTGGVEEASRAAAALHTDGFSAAKLKVGAGDDDLDVRRASAVARAAPGVALLLDANGGYDAARALALLRALRNLGIEPALLEQPVPAESWEQLREVTARAGVPVAADESASSVEDVVRIARERAAHVVNLKIMKSGLGEALAMARRARSLGLGLMIGGMVESRLAMSASACLAAGLGGFSFVDLDTPYFLAEDPFEGGMELAGPRLRLGRISEGHGVRRRAARA